MTTDPLERNYSTRLRYCKVPVKEENLSSQESTNCAVFVENSHADPCAVPICSKNGKSELQSHVPSSVLRESATNSVQDRIVPLSGNPYFTCILMKSHIQNPFQMVVPKNFCPLLPSASVPVILKCRNKRWKMIYYGDRSLKRFNPEWRQFSIDNNLKIGDGCIFELMNSKNLEVRVQILRGQVPPETVKSGGNSGNPIMIL